MALIVEDGTAKADADSYISVLDANTYHRSRGNTDWENFDSVEDKEPALRKATDYLVQTYRHLWAGSRKSSAQSLDWPRYWVPINDVPGYVNSPDYFSETEVPREVKNACAELALKIANGIELSPDLEPPVIEERVGPIVMKYAQGSRQYKRYPAIDNALSPYLSNSNYTFSMNRG